MQVWQCSTAWDLWWNFPKIGHLQIFLTKIVVLLEFLCGTLPNVAKSLEKVTLPQTHFRPEIYIPIHCISSNKGPRPLFNFKGAVVIEGWRLKKGVLFKVRNYSHATQNLLFSFRITKNNCRYVNFHNY